MLGNAFIVLYIDMVDIPPGTPEEETYQENLLTSLAETRKS